MYISEESKIAPTIVVLFSFPGFRFTDKVLHYLIFGALYTKKKLVFLSLPKKSFTYTYGLIFGASYTKKSNASYFKSANSKADPCHII